jgi:O-antigen/teichoic acid export membrane protein
VKVVGGGAEVELRHALPAGLLDAGFASLATLGVGLYAAQALPLSEFGAYALFFSAFVLAAVVPAQLILSPAAFATVSASAIGIERLGLLRQTWRLGTLPAAIAAIVASAAAWFSAEAPDSVLWALAVTTTTCSIVSPLQDHLRRILHLANISWYAALVSLVQLCSVFGALAFFEVVGVGPIWRPFGALTLANVVSLAVGVALAYRRSREPTLPRYQAGHLMRSGRWLLLQEAAITSAVFVSSAVVTQLAGPEALGHAEAARIVAQPLFVLTAGLSSVLWPQSIEAGATRSREAARRTARPFTRFLVAAGLLYGAVTAGPWGGNPLAALVPQAYTVTGLVPLTVVAYVLLGLPFLSRAELIGAGRERILPWIGMFAGTLQCVAAVSALWIEAFARPLGAIIFGTVVAFGYRRYRRTVYTEYPKRT